MKYQKIEMAKMTCQASNKCQVTNTMNKIELPFPPSITATDIVNRRKPSKVKSKSPNAFLIYRKQFLDVLSNSKHNLRMTDVSKLVSRYWKSEPEQVKEEYRKIAQQVDVELNEKRKVSVPYRVVWKNSKYSRKRNQYGKLTEIKEKDSTFKAAVPSVRENVFYQFVHTFPDAEFTSKSSKKREKEIILTPETKTSCSSPTTPTTPTTPITPTTPVTPMTPITPITPMTPMTPQSPAFNFNNHLYPSPCGDIGIMYDPNVDWYFQDLLFDNN
jgi:hypothetical protein